MDPEEARPPVVDLTEVEELLTQLTKLRRHPRYRQLLAEGTGFEGRITTMRVLRTIDVLTHGADRPSVGAVADRLGMEQANTSRAVELGIQRGLMWKRPSGSDARRAELGLTEAGVMAMGKLNARRDALHEKMLLTWRAGEMSELVFLLTKLCETYKSIEA